MNRRCQQPGCDQDATRRFEAKPEFRATWLRFIFLCKTCTANGAVYDQKNEE